MVSSAFFSPYLPNILFPSSLIVNKNVNPPGITGSASCTLDPPSVAGVSSASSLVLVVDVPTFFFVLVFLLSFVGSMYYSRLLHSSTEELICIRNGTETDIQIILQSLVRSISSHLPHSPLFFLLILVIGY